MINTLAYVVITLTAPLLYAGEELVTTEPMECAAAIDLYLATLAANGFKADAKCIYTSAPVTSPQPQLRPN